MRIFPCKRILTWVPPRANQIKKFIADFRVDKGHINDNFWLSNATLKPTVPEAQYKKTVVATISRIYTTDRIVESCRNLKCSQLLGIWYLTQTPLAKCYGIDLNFTLQKEKVWNSNILFTKSVSTCPYTMCIRNKYCTLYRDLKLKIHYKIHISLTHFWGQNVRAAPAGPEAICLITKLKLIF